LAGGHGSDHGQPGGDGPGSDVLAQQQRRPTQGEHRLGELKLGEAGDAALGEAAVPRETCARCRSHRRRRPASRLLADALSRTGARLVHAQPTFANPTGAVLAQTRRGAVLDVVRAAGAFLLEDDRARHLGVDRPAPPPLIREDGRGHVVYLTSLTKPAAPSLRVGALVAPGPAAARLTAIRTVEDLFVARLCRRSPSSSSSHLPGHGT